MTLAKIAHKIFNQTIVLIIFILSVSSSFSNDTYAPRDGDLVFQVSGSAQAAAVRLATGATYTHGGIIFLRDGLPMVLEAGGNSVKFSRLEDFIKRGEDQKFVVKRIKNANKILTVDVLNQILVLGQAFVGLEYDRYFNWSDDQMYCTELVWKIFRRGADVKIGNLKVMGDFNLFHPSVKKILQERYGDNIPVSENVISPSELFNSEILETVYEN